jgi:hypothetical protein
MLKNIYDLYPQKEKALKFFIADLLRLTYLFIFFLHGKFLPYHKKKSKRRYGEN